MKARSSAVFVACLVSILLFLLSKKGIATQEKREVVIAVGAADFELDPQKMENVEADHCKRLESL